jgi:hypothetical protein
MNSKIVNSEMMVVTKKEKNNMSDADFFIVRAKKVIEI